MNDEKRTVLVAALSAYADLLANNTARLDLEEGKGKTKASDDDVDLKVEIQDQLKLCGELTSDISNPTFGKDFARTFEPAENDSCEGLRNQLKESTAVWKGKNDDSWWTPFLQDYSTSEVARNQPTKTGFFSTQKPYMIEDEPYANPYTGLPVIPETGYEAGPSNRPPPPLRKPPSPPSGKPIRPPPKPPHLRSPGVLTRSATLPPQRPAPPPPPEPQQLQRRQTVSARVPEDSLARMGSIARKPVATKQQATISTVQPYHPSLNLSPPPQYEQSSVPIPYRLDWETQGQDRHERFPGHGGYVPNTTRGNYLHHIAELASKAIKAAGNMVNITRTPSVSRSQSLLPLSVTDRSQQPPEYISETRSVISGTWTQPPTRSSQPEPSQDGSSRANSAPSHASRKSSMASFSSAADSSIFTTSPSSSSQTGAFSPGSSSTSFSQGAQDDYIWSVSPSMSSSPTLIPQLQKRSTWTSTPPMAAVLQSGASSSLSLPNVTPGIKRSMTWTPSATPLPRRSSNSSLISPTLSTESTTQTNYRDRGYTISSASNQHISRRASSSSVMARTFNSEANQGKGGLESLHSGNLVPNRHTTSNTFTDATFKQIPFLDQASSTAGNHSSTPTATKPSIKPSFNQQGRYELQSPPRPRFGSPGSNNPWKDHMAADEAFAKSLQQKEYQDIQMERDLLLAYALANGTAKDEDVELAYFMAKETATLIASTAAVPQSLPTPEASIHTSADLLDMDNKTAQMQLDLFEARQVEMELRAQESADGASLSEAKRLQAEFDKEARDEEEAWEDWKKGNIEECIVCGDEQHREELLRPCEHGFCEGCLQDGFKNALDSRTPFKCCKRLLSLEDCSGLSDEFVTAYEEMMLELTTPNPMYCCNAQCAKFLPPSAIVGDVGSCSKCKTQTCRHCRKHLHPGTFCEEDKETKAVKDLAKTQGWKTCPGCNHLIERRDGCLHMICSRCQTAFCYRCSKPWKLCESTCPDAISALHPKV